MTLPRFLRLATGAFPATTVQGHDGALSRTTWTTGGNALSAPKQCHGGRAHAGRWRRNRYPSLSVAALAVPLCLPRYRPWYSRFSIFETSLIMQSTDRATWSSDSGLKLVSCTDYQGPCTGPRPLRCTQQCLFVVCIFTGALVRPLESLSGCSGSAALSSPRYAASHSHQCDR